MGANCCGCHKGTVESVQGSIMSLTDLKNQARDLEEMVVEETRDDAGPPSPTSSPSEVEVLATGLKEMVVEVARDYAGPSEPLPLSPTSSPSEIEEISQSVCLVSQDETSDTKESPKNLDQDEVSSFEASNYLWSTGLFPYPIPSGFYSVVPVERLKLSKSIPTMEEINALEDHERLKAGVICVDFKKDYKLRLLKLLYYGLVSGLNSEPVKVIKKTAELVVKAKRSQSFKSRGFPLLGNIIKHGSCRARAILFKVLADTVRLESKLVVGFPSDLGSSSSVDPRYHMSVVVALDGVEMLVDLKRCPGQLKPFSPKEVYLAHVSTAWQTGFVDSDSCASPLEPNSPMERSGSSSVLQSGSSGSRNKLIIKEQGSPGSSSNSNGTAEPETEGIRSRRMKTPKISPGEGSQMVIDIVAI
ncbi:PREDICTED: serine/threonine-protein kinase EDR1-like [Camelina sativa]|uniref:Serine/threonine-protein kinase EDR1-like n=1 Tax=Camelina sativa TaxID=90675 RepID=A0ABM0YUK5_CAMSA|nr:PREDICTED: serine/threonine-protein kinase EDR1-like [Camelina sativa]